jgi:hypothetical protein
MEVNFNLMCGGTYAGQWAPRQYLSTACCEKKIVPLRRAIFRFWDTTISLLEEGLILWKNAFTNIFLYSKKYLKPSVCFSV